MERKGVSGSVINPTLSRSTEQRREESQSLHIVRRQICVFNCSGNFKSSFSLNEY